MKTLRIDWIDYADTNSIAQFTLGRTSQVGEWCIHFNEEIESVDAFFVIEGSRPSQTNVNVPDGMLFFGSGDTIWQPGTYANFEWRLDYLKQFDWVYSCHDTYLHNSVAAMPFHHWMINTNTGKRSIPDSERDLDYLYKMSPPEKSRNLSVFCSTKQFTPGHKMRYRFVSEIKKYFGDNLDWYGNGTGLSVQEKWEGLIDYRYSIAIENQCRYNMITEKILDPFLAFTFPIYFGAPNIDEYFENCSFRRINIEDPEGAKRLIANLLESNTYETSLDCIKESRNKVLAKYNFVTRIVNIVDEKFQSLSTVKRSDRLIKPMHQFQPLRQKFRDEMARLRHVILPWS